jgi:hypothetical protein
MEDNKKDVADQDRYSTDALLKAALDYIKANKLNVAAHPEISYLQLRMLERIETKIDSAADAFNRLAAAIEQQNEIALQQGTIAKPSQLKPLGKKKTS